MQQAEDLYELTCGRYQRACTIVVSRYPLFRNPVLAEGPLDRLVNTAPITRSCWAEATGPCAGPTA